MFEIFYNMRSHKIQLISLWITDCVPLYFLDPEDIENQSLWEMRNKKRRKNNQ